MMQTLRARWQEIGPSVAALGLLATVPLWIEHVGLYQYLGLEILIWCIFALGFNLALGYTGLPSFGHGAYFGLGAYAMALYQLEYGGRSLWGGLLASVLIGLIAGGLVGSFISHRRGIYFALLTVGFGQMIWFSAIRLRQFTHGEDGLLGLARLPLDLGVASLPLTDTIRLYYFTLAILAAVSLGLNLVIHSPFGSIIQAIKQNELRSRFIGYDVRRYKWLSFTLSTGIAGLAGGLFALAQQSAFPDVMSLRWSGTVVMMTIIGGGLVSFWGPVAGAIFFFLARDLLGRWTETWMLWYGLVFMLIIVFQPEGLIGIWQRYRPRGKTAAVTGPISGLLAQRSPVSPPTHQPPAPQPAPAETDGTL